jgi:hypothetical protein
MTNVIIYVSPHKTTSDLVRLLRYELTYSFLTLATSNVHKDKVLSKREPLNMEFITRDILLHRLIVMMMYLVTRYHGEHDHK